MKAHRLSLFILLLLFGTHAALAQKLILVHAVKNKTGRVYVLVPKGDRFYVEENFSAKFGMNGVGKTRLHDKKTPLGHYKISHSAKRRRDLKKYGGYYIEIDYPNFYDKRDGKTGSDIGFHGGRDNNTLGCVRIMDDRGARVSKVNITKLTRHAKVGTHVIISTSIPASLRGDRRGYLSPEASAFWKNVMARRRSYQYLVQQSQTFGGKQIDKDVYYLGKITTKETFVNVRVSPEKDANMVGMVVQGNPLLYVPHNDEWFKVWLPNGSEGYVDKNEMGEVMIDPSGKAVINDSDGWTNVRSGKNMDAKVVGKILKHDEFWYKETSEDWWKVISEEGVEGYMHYSRITPIKQAYRFSISKSLRDYEPVRTLQVGNPE